jgi:dGTPase
MLHTRTERIELEEVHLAAYAARSGTSCGRVHSEPPHPYRAEYQRDRDRVLHCRAFRRLEYKTQVFVHVIADHYRTRLTHTMEMTAIGRTMARALAVNEDLTEAIALAHDIGHSPFGHCGERELDALMKDDGGFDHNLQSLRWVELLERRYPGFTGLNLTWEVRAGLRKHMAATPGAELDGRPIGPYQYMEAQIADVADDIAYQSHDVEDGLEAGLLSHDLLQELALWRMADARCRAHYGEVPEADRAAYVIRFLLDMQVEDVLRTTSARLRQHQPDSPAAVMQASERMVAFSEEMTGLLQPYREFLFKELYWHPAVDESNQHAVQLMRRLFHHYVEHPDTMGRRARQQVERDGLMRSACDYVAGMTDVYAMEEVRRFGLDR